MTTTTNVCTESTCDSYRMRDTVHSTETFAGGRIDVLNHVDHPWHGAAVRVVLDNRAADTRFFRTRSAARVWVETHAPGFNPRLRDAFYAAAGEAFYLAAQGEPGRFVRVLVRSGRPAGKANRPEAVALIDPQWNADRVIGELRQHPYWTLLFDPPEDYADIPRRLRPDVRAFWDMSRFPRKQGQKRRKVEQ